MPIDRGTAAAIDQFLTDVAEAIPGAMERFPQPNPVVAALGDDT